ncbi:7TMR-DISM extracellular 2 [Hymenobacter daecheongensis DSM 21074]|uniref:7TMR-DISM extracellular 2 n=1 Tax=Hymenobacter daecheongensis DSM 21074 TaxID=1121955 RepID=A0A1M6G7F6_9BACT|nr:7TM diverse intracellular signaling domain-containing protein [Hymenobacter daecheongensis]SHJ05915.1 7TMR-DISM extracellular 2 [Hymenobacter daecheongensis DSM 21074]
MTRCPEFLAPQCSQPVPARACLLSALFWLLGVVAGLAAPTEDTLRIRPNVNELYVSTASYSVLEDPSGRLTLRDILQPRYNAGFLPGNLTSGGKPSGNIEHTRSAYWLRIRVRNEAPDQNHWFLEMFDSHINDLTFYRADAQGTYHGVRTGADLPFASRPFAYKNFLFSLQVRPGQTHTYYLRLKSDSKTSFLGRLRNESMLAAHFQSEYGLLGGFYGVLLIMVVYNLFIFLFIGERTYLRYVLYVLSCSLLFLSEDGLGFEYLWPRLPWLNQVVNAGAPILLLVTFSYYARHFLDAPQRLPHFDPWVRAVVLLSAGLLLLDTLFVKSGFSFWLYLLPYGMLYYAALLVYRQGFRAARFFLIAQALVAVSLLFLITRKLGVDFINTPFTVYSMNVAFVVEVAVLSYALGEKIKAIKDATIRTQERLVKQLHKKHQAQDRLVEQLRQNQELKDQLNSELEEQVARRTEKLRLQSETIAAQNRELQQANGLLALQSAAISKLNGELQHDLQQVQTARVLSKEVDFGEFSQIYPDKDACLRYLADLKWAAGYRCRKCGHEKYCDAREPHARRCTKCRYVESATAYTMLQKCKFSIIKAFYAVFLIYTHKGSYSSQELSRVLELRQGTCWSFSQKVTEAMRRRRQAAGYDEHEGWTHILLDATGTSEEDQPILQTEHS